MSNRLGNRDLAVLYWGFHEDYKNLTKDYEPKTPEAIAEINAKLFNKLFSCVTNPDDPLCNLSYEQKQQAFKALDTFISSRPNAPSDYNRLLELLSRAVNNPNHKVDSHVASYTERHDAFWDGFWFSWFFNYLCCSSDKKGNDKRNTFSALMLFALVIAIASIALIAFYYMVNFLFSGVERLVYSEGWWQAITTLSSTIGGAIAGALFGYYIASVPLMMLGFSLGLSNPVGLAIAGIVCLTFVGGFLAGGITTWAHNYFVKSWNQDALVPQDPRRFTITDAEVDKLEDDGFDTTAARCGVLEAWLKVSSNGGLNNRTYRLFSAEGEKEQDAVEFVRHLRSGNKNMLHGCSLGKNWFNFSWTGLCSCPPKEDIEEAIAARRSSLENPNIVYLPDMHIGSAFIPHPQDFIADDFGQQSTEQPPYVGVVPGGAVYAESGPGWFQQPQLQSFPVIGASLDSTIMDMPTKT